MKISQLNKIQSVSGLEELGIGKLQYDIGGRGGYLGFYGSDVAAALNVNANDLPGKFGVYCNYLGGGIRGAVTASGYNKACSKAALLDALSAACKRAYVNAEAELNDETYEDGDTNWDAIATKAARAAGTKSAY
jgi:hypothetical protein